jgi:4-diphosphocytidyl-2-C-methyl-D-erythritol kinase
MRLSTPAKVTVNLNILGRRKDGFHDVRGVLVPVSLYDTLEIERTPDKGLSLEVDSPEDLGARENNLVWRAVRAFEAAAGIRVGVAIRLTKRIPTGAGLGGGSGNAAATLVVCNRLWGQPLGAPALHREAAALGSDVPFFLEPGPALIEGRGERLRRLTGFPRLVLLVVKPDFALATGEAYRLLAEARQGRAPAPSSQSLPALTTLSGVLAALHNDFEPVQFAQHPELAEIKARLSAAGAQGALLSGTGSALFGIFATAAARDAAAAELAGAAEIAGAAQQAGVAPARTGRWTVLACESLSGHAYESEA